MQGTGRIEKERLLTEQAASGKSIASFSRERGMDPQVLYEFRKRRNKSETGSFALVQTSVTVQIELVSGIRITAPLESLNAVLKELAARGEL